MTELKTLKHSKEIYEGEIKAGDIVIFENFVDNSGEIPSVTIELVKVAKVDLENESFTPENTDIPLPIYRIRYVIDKEKGESLPYAGHDFYRISMDEGQMTQETYNAVKALEETKKGIG